MPAKHIRPKRVEMPEVAWIGENKAFLEENYSGKWIAVKGRELAAVGDSVRAQRIGYLGRGQL